MSLTLWEMVEEHRLRVSKKYWGKARTKEEVMGDWENCKKSFMILTPYKIRVIEQGRVRWSEHVIRMGRKRNAYKRWVGKPEAWFALYGQLCSSQERAKRASLSLHRSVCSSDHFQGTTLLFRHTAEHLACSWMECDCFNNMNRVWKKEITWESLGMGVGIMWKWVLGKYERIAWTGSMWVRVGTSGGNA